MKCEIKFSGKDHETKSFKDNIAALAFIMRNREKIDSVNYQPIKVLGLDMKLRPMSVSELERLLDGKDPFGD